MATYLISYDLLNSVTEDYDKVFKYIEAHGTWAHITESLWGIKTEKTAVQIRDELQNITKNGSAIFVIKSGVEAAWANVICRNQWLKDNL
ncbi:MAG: hypothetical protein FWB77_02670 [Treponema sp.]|nr:hypothetical protein [Treponema sp.]